jgi:hypothetical protein
MSLQELQAGMEWGQLARTIINTAIRKIKDASTTVAGLVRLATNSETTTGTSTTLATTPAGVKAVIDALKAAANTWTAAQTISVTATGTALAIISDDDGASEGPTISLVRDSADPAASDVVGAIRFRGRDGGGNDTVYFAIFGQIIDATDASEDGRMILRSIGAGAARDWYLESGALRYSTQTQPSNAGEIAAVAYKVGANQVVGARVTGWGAPTGTATRTTFATGSVTTEQLAERVKALIDDLTTHGVIGA